MSNWYDFPTVIAERAILASGITFTKIEDLEGAFFIPVFTPTMDNYDTSVDNRMRSPGNKSQTGTKLTTTNYIESNNINLIIPAYIVREFHDPFMMVNYIPKGTEFIITGINGKNRVDEIRITGLFKIGEE